MTKAESQGPRAWGRASVTPSHQAAPDSEVGFVDRFEDEQQAGRVIGSVATTGVRRRGVDVEQVMAVDNGALRIGMLKTPGWGRAGLSYGPFLRKPGLVLAAVVLNGHNTSQTYELTDRYPKRVARWVLGCPGTDSLLWRLVRWRRRLAKESARRRLACWWEHRRGHGGKVKITDNLAVGFFTSETPVEPPPPNEGPVFVMRAASHENGELRVRIGPAAPAGSGGRGNVADTAAGGMLTVSKNVQNLPIAYVVALRERGAAYYVGSLAGAHGMAGLPRLRPVGIDAASTEKRLYAGVHQSVLGEIGFSVDTRVQRVAVKPVGAWGAWYGSASAADSLGTGAGSGSGPVEGTEAEAGGVWRGVKGSFQRTPMGARSIAAGSVAVLALSEPAGLVHVIVTGGEAGAMAGVLFRWRDEGNGWKVEVGTAGWRVLCREGGADWAEVAKGEEPALAAKASAALQVLDDGERIQVWLDGVALLGEGIEDARLAGECGVGLSVDAADGGVRLRMFEAHPREVEAPEGLCLEMPWHGGGGGDEVVVADEFAGAEGATGAMDLDGRKTAVGDREWVKVLGRGRIEVVRGEEGSAGLARVAASVAEPNPGRMIYAVEWDRPEFADVTVEMTPPGSGRGERHNGRSGVVLWQDEDNYVVVNLWLDDQFAGSSISSFFYLNGHEDVYDAVWTNVGARVAWGRRFALRVVFDGVRYLAMVDGEPVLWRSLTDVYPGIEPLAITRVGLCANWEFGNDTGTVFHRFEARGRIGSLR